MYTPEARTYWGDRRISRRRILYKGAQIGTIGLAAAGGGIGVLAACEKTLNYLASQGGYGEPRGNREILKLTLSPIANDMQEVVGPLVRERPKDSAKAISPEELLKRGVDITGTVRGIPWWGGSYPSNIYEQGLVPKNDRGGYRGKWAAIVNNDGDIIGFASENYVTYISEEK